MTITKVCFFGAGHRGGTLAVEVALHCPHIKVYVVDKNEEKIHMWVTKRVPVFRPDLPQAVTMLKKIENLFFTTDEKALNADVIFLCTEGEQGFEWEKLREDALVIANTIERSNIIVNESSILFGATEIVKSVLKAQGSPCIQTFITIPELIMENHIFSGTAGPGKLIMGCDESEKGAQALDELISLYGQWIQRSSIETTDTSSAEITHLIVIAMTLQSIVTFNWVAEMCEITDADLNDVMGVFTMLPKIYFRFMKNRLGFTTLNFNKIMKCLSHVFRTFGLHDTATYWQELLEFYRCQSLRFAKGLMGAFPGFIADRTIVFLGFTSEYNRHFVVYYMAEIALKENAFLRICDQMVPREVIMKNLALLLQDCSLKSDLMERVEVFTDPYEATVGAEAVILCTNWPGMVVNFKKIYDEMLKPAYVFDCLTQLPREELTNIGFLVQDVGNVFKCY